MDVRSSFYGLALTKINSRYQETSLSPRCLVFLSGFVYFNCNVAVYSEHVRTEVEGIEPEISANTLGKAEDQYAPALQRYSQHIQAYTSRALTYQSDIHNAFQGIAKELTWSMSISQVYYGLPTSCFDWALLWGGQNICCRRPGFPTWSWMGWQGAINMSQSSIADYNQMWLLRATWIDWHIVDKDGGCRTVWNTNDTSNKVSLKHEAIVDNNTKRRKDEDDDLDIELSEEQSRTPDPCPTYGNSTQDNPFGRLGHHNVIFQGLERGGRVTGDRYSRCHSMELAALCFYAPTITLSARLATQPTHTPQSDSHVAALSDSQGRMCGILSVADIERWSNGYESAVKLVLLSITSYGDLSIHHAAGWTSSIYGAFEEEGDLTDYVETLPEDVDHFDFINVLFVPETDRKARLVVNGELRSVTVCERAGVGTVYRRSLPGLKDITWCDIVLA